MSENRKKQKIGLAPKTSTTEDSTDDEQTEALDLSIKKKPTKTEEDDEPTYPQWFNTIKTLEKPVDTRVPWGCIQFYESNKLVFYEELRGDEPIAIDSTTIVFARPPQLDYNDPRPNPNMAYSDWKHVIGKGFSLTRSTNGVFSSIEMRILEEAGNIKNKYKIFVDDKQITVANNDIYEIYDGDGILSKRLNDGINDMNAAYELAHACHLIIAVYGEFTKTVPLSYEMICRDMIPSYPYWFYLKLYPEFSQIDRQAEYMCRTRIYND